MKVRLGTYTIIKGIEMKLSGNRYEVPTSEFEKTYSISYPAVLGKMDEFRLYKQPYPYFDEYMKEVYIKDIKNAFFVVTKAKYQGEVFEVEPYYGDEIHLHLATKDLELGKKLNFYELHDGEGNSYYLGEVKITEVEKIWEERQKSSLDIPLPENFELYKEIQLESE